MQKKRALMDYSINQTYFSFYQKGFPIQPDSVKGQVVCRSLNI